MGHFESGFEDLTLEPVYRYCTMHRPMDYVAYFHNKGSYKTSIKNQRFRQHLIKGVFSYACQEAVSENDYDLCCTKFVGFPISHCVGNMFVTTCQHIRTNLPSPLAFGRLRRRVHEDMMKQAHQQVKDTGLAVFRVNKTTQLHADRPIEFRMNNASVMHQNMSHEAWIGMNRHAAEHWIGSNPGLRPVTVVPKRIMLEYLAVSQDLSWHPRMRTQFMVYGSLQLAAPPFFRLEGRLYLYEKLYGALPSNDSWVWKYYLPSL